MSDEPSEIEHLQGKQILLVDDNLEILRSVKFELEQYGLEVSTCESAFDIPERLDDAIITFDLVITDLMGMKKDERNFISYRDLQPIVESYSEVPFLIYSTDDESAMQYEEKGLRGFVLKEDGIAELLNAMNHILFQNQPRYYFSKSISYDKRLSLQEYQVLRCVGRDGFDTRGTARELSLSRYTVDDYLRNIRKKLGAEDTKNAIAIAYEKGII